MNCKDNLEEYLRDKGVPYELQHHAKAFTAQDVAASEHIPGRLLAKVVMLIAGGENAMLVLPAPEHAYIPEVASYLGTKEVHLAEERDLRNMFPDCELGAMPPFGNLYNVPVYVDQALADEETIFFQAGTHTDTISMRYADYERLVNPVVAPFTRGEALARYAG